MPDAVSLRLQLACATRELALRVSRTHGYPRLIALGTMRPEAAERELTAMQAIVQTRTTLAQAEDDVSGRAEGCGAGEGEP